MLRAALVLLSVPLWLVSARAQNAKSAGDSDLTTDDEKMLSTTCAIVQDEDTQLNQHDQNHCAFLHFEEAETKHNALYRRLVNDLQRDIAGEQRRREADQYKYELASLAKLKASEAAWIKYRDLHCDAVKHTYEGGSAQPAEWGECMAELTRDRIKELKSAFVDDVEGDSPKQ